MADLVYQVLSGFTNGMILWLIAAGLTVAFGVLGILNFAHGSIYMLGAYLAYTFYQMMGLNFAISVVLAVVSVGGIGFLLERFALRPIYARPLEIQLILLFGVMLIFADVALLGWGTALTFPRVPGLVAGTVNILGREFPIYYLFLSGCGIAVFFLIQGLLAGTWWGRTMRAAASDREMASAIGINIRTVFSTAFVFASAIAAFGGALSMPMKMPQPGMGTEVIIPAFVVVAVGSLGNLEGAFVAAIMIGVVSSLLTLYVPIIEVISIYLIMAVVLIIKPEGLFGKAR
jgi:branched-subunit amino acid ABC-type transport system permease component